MNAPDLSWLDAAIAHTRRNARVVAEAEALVDALFGPGGHEARGYSKCSIGIAARLRDAVRDEHPTTSPGRAEH